MRLGHCKSSDFLLVLLTSHFGHFGHPPAWLACLEVLGCGHKSCCGALVEGALSRSGGAGGEPAQMQGSTACAGSVFFGAAAKALE